MNSSSSINRYLKELKIGVHEMVKGKLSPFLVSPTILKRTIRHIQFILAEKFKDFYLLNTDPTYYYSSSQLYTRKHSTLYVTLKFPISTFSSPLFLYKVNSYPVPLNKTSTHGTQILNLKDYFIVTQDNRYYASVSHDKLRLCSGTTTLFCPNSLPLTSTVFTTCISSLYFNSKSDIHKYCDFRQYQTWHHRSV